MASQSRVITFVMDGGMEVTRLADSRTQRLADSHLVFDLRYLKFATIPSKHRHRLSMWFVTLLRFLALVVVLNIIRYVVGGLIEGPLIFPRLFGVMTENPGYFNSDFQTIDWVTSYLYNFAMWAVAVWIYHISRPVLSGSEIVRSLKVFGITFLFFASVSFIYMNHYSHPNEFYVINVADALVVYLLVGLSNGLLYPLFMGSKRATGHAAIE